MRIYTFDIILLDIDMPLLNGVETAKQIRANLNSTVPIIAVTTNDSIESKDNYLKVGMVKCLGKPVNLQLLEQTISKSLIYSSPLTLTPPIKE
ncbi:CheY-like superfamily [Gilbertella persicaria]|uniref:CheY-like superfamily n=1 Tax=Gilbertella persicaria TaxID=101096 RepID=UPI00221FD634|nr:CheY-like superfamily [Gilbertella persicaria]KAI8075810.1 CheY-like superfamily [Gilbertella persicaria]